MGGASEEREEREGRWVEEGRWVLTVEEGRRDWEEGVAMEGVEGGEEGLLGRRGEEVEVVR